MLPEERFRKAVAIFFKNNPGAAAELERLSPSVAEHLGISFDDFKKHEAHKLFGKYAASKGLDVPLVVIELTASSPGELNELKSKHFRTLAETLGVSWEEYVELNPHLSGL